MSGSTGSAASSIAKGHPSLLFATLMLGLVSQGLAMTAVVSALPEMARDLGSRGEFMAQMTMALAALGLMLGALASGWILAEAGTRLTLLTSLLVFGLAGAGGVFLREPSLLLASRFGVGFASACVATTCVWGIGTEYEGHRRARAFGVAGALSSVVSLIGTLLGGYLARQGGWPLAFVQYPIFGVAGFLLAFASIRQVRPERERKEEVSQPYLKQLLPFYLLVMLLFTIFVMGGTQLPFLLQEDGLRDPVVRSRVLAVPTIGAIASSLAYGPLQRLLTTRGAFMLALSCMAAGLATVGGVVTPAYVALGASMMGICIGLVGPYLYHAVTERTDAHSRGRHIGLLNAFTFLGVFLNPIVFAPLSAAIGTRKVFLIAALIVAAVVLFTARNPRRRCGNMTEKQAVT